MSYLGSIGTLSQVPAFRMEGWCAIPVQVFCADGGLSRRLPAGVDALAGARNPAQRLQLLAQLARSLIGSLNLTQQVVFLSPDAVTFSKSSQTN